MEETVSNLRSLYAETRDAIIKAPLSAAQITAFKKQLALQPLTGISGLDKKLANAYSDLIIANLTYTAHQLYFVLNLNHDHTTITLPISPHQLQDWLKTHAAEYTLFTRNPFLYNGLSIDETAAAALL